MEKPAAFVTVDLGASGGKVSVGTFEEDGFRLQEAHRFDNGGTTLWTQGNSGQVTEKTYWDDLALYAQTVEGLRKVGAMATAPVAGVGIDIWGADAALLNRHGESLGPIHCYRDHRLDTLRDELFKRISPRELFDLSGIPSQPWYLINQLFWLVEHRREMLDIVDAVVPIGSMMQYGLCGSKSAEATWMAVQQLTRAGTGEYDDRLLAVAGVPRRILPDVVAPGTVVGTLRKELAESTGLGPCKIVAPKSHDTASAFTAAMVTDPDKSLIVSSGTWSLVGKLAVEPLVTDAVFEGGLSNEGVRGDVRLLRNVMGTWPVQQLRASWGRADGGEMAWDEIVELAESAPALDIHVDVDDQALYNPPDMEAAVRGQIERTGQIQPADRGELLRAVYKGLGEKIAYVNTLLEEVTDSRHESVHIVGGGARNGLLNQFIADATGLPVQAGPYEATGIGNILVQAVACGLFDSVERARAAVAGDMETQTFQPAKG